MAIDQAKVEALIKASSDLVSRLDEHDVIRKIIADASNVINAQSCSLILVDPDSDECFFTTPQGRRPSSLKKSDSKKSSALPAR